ncbi:serine/threonine-protein kinase 11-interacting protein isoform X1 [Gopherus flavomarginatus]|uniref:serine/threonine-protein kinase 11-interacting protein isoform X1 n=1 Tax=Gopherus flavomarginatus TaxID=286002 RepID=UPI0021CC2773|nr:serine/threonine-protein kinase 11-interacting protein isoform X1 [Gopherus flavomarginatus]XP_050825604.1 serine/threonine-protein kinase 11-interacting protein isoform X1 [Gopherus flavomarginatus]XP_050825605.1 serine/threonine-protein kinase 11-interacting protein isoform X1 [Gopherus flavomarginatus]XP_050825606.1 serine/threonine-protein kinase 11-interacting protein isoform X1 [Gopherus flavomarginatus]XP_050825607.1 serine/threonine-protein kinase 11-interacting protein isoform X1 [G
MAPAAPGEMLVQGLARLLQDSGDLVLDGTSTLTLLTSTLQHLTQVFEQHLVSRNQNHGFIALPSHPADTSAILQAQFLFDILQKTLSLKLVHVPSCNLQSSVKIFPFKSLRRLELKSVPLHCLRGLRFVYSQLEALTCSKCVSTLEEVISACGGDLSSALPWLELQTVNFSYNTITVLDGSLQLLNALKVLDLSHNRIWDCEHYLTTLTELEYLNLAYNFLPKLPDLGLCSRTKLVTLILRSNELDSINGVEQLLNLQHLDVAYNLLLEHAQLAPLSMLHNMRKLYLEGNPLWFHQNHRSATIVHLSPRAASFTLLLDGELLTTSDLMHLPKSGQVIAQSIRSSTSEKTLLDRSALDSSYGADLSDSQSPGESGAARLPQRKSKGNVKVRRPSISEPSDTEHEYQALLSSAGMVLRHQKEMERMDAFRDHFGADWLQYKRQLEEHGREGPVISLSCPAKEVPGSLPGTDTPSKSTTQEQETPSELLRDTFLPLDSMREEEKESQLEESLRESQKGEMEADEVVAQEEEEKPEVDLCQPVLVSQIEGDGDPEPDWIFLRVTARHVIEVELKAARVLHKLELRSLQKVETSEMTWKRMDTSKKGPAQCAVQFSAKSQEHIAAGWPLLPGIWAFCCISSLQDLERVFPVLTLHFSYIRKDRQKRRYVVLDDHPELCVQCVLRVLSPALEENRRRPGVEEGSMKLQCLKCKQEFAQPLALWQQSPYPAPAEGGKGMETSAQPNQEATAPGEPMVCPSCSSDHVVLLPCERRSSTPLPSQHHADKALSEPGPQGSLEAASVLGSQSRQFYIGGEDDGSETDPRTQELSGDHGSTVHSSSDGDGRRKELGLKSCYSSLSRTDTSGGSLMGSYRYGASRGPTPSQLSLNSESEETWNLSPSTNSTLDVRDFRSVDHRLRLYLDMEVFEENVEEFQCFLKVAMVKFGRYGEFPALLVASDLRIHVLEVTGEIRGQPVDWLKKNDSHYLSDLCYLEMGLGHQSLRMEFDNPKASYNLLIRNQSRCDQFLQCLTYLLQELPGKPRSRVKEIHTVEMNPQHRLWPLLEKALCSVAVDSTSSCFFYLLAYLIQGASAFPVTLLSTCSTLFLLEENHQWQRVQPTPGAAGEKEVPPKSSVQLKEKQPISSISSIITYRFSPCDVKLMFYDEVLKVESTWHIHTECPELLAQLVEWIRGPWEEMFSIELRKTMQEVLE